jgi:SnoaL-like domain
VPGVSQRNLELVRASIDHFNREGHLPPELHQREVLLFNAPESPIPGPYRGHEGLLTWRDDLLEVVEDARFEITDLEDIDEADLVIFELRLRGRARHTGIAVDVGWTLVNWFRDGLIDRIEAHSHRADALAAAGLSG